MLSVQVWHWQIEDSRCWLSYFREGGVRGEEAMSCIFHILLAIVSLLGQRERRGYV